MDQAAVLMELKVNLGLPWKKLAHRPCLTKSRVLDLVGLLDLPDEIKEDIRHKKLTEKHGGDGDDEEDIDRKEYEWEKKLDEK